MALKTVKKKKVLIALSGGIDSAVSAALLMKQGYHVEAAFMKNWSSTAGLLRSDCPWLEDRRVAIKVAAHLGIPLHTFDFEKEYEQNVMSYFFKEYAAGRTPNPDVMCNKEIKFKLLYKAAMKMGFNFLATGHYAQVKESKGNFSLVRSRDEFKDQTYFIYGLKKEQLSHILFPVGGMNKSEVRAIAKKLKLPNAKRKESMGLCFVGKVRLDEFIKQKVKVKPGNIVTLQNKVIGKHKGLALYTIGQRHGLKVGGSGPYYVVSKDIRKNTLVVTDNPNDPALKVKNIQIHGLNLLEDVKFPLKAVGRFRHQQELQKLTLSKGSKNSFNVEFEEEQMAVASGQSLVLYLGKTCIGGGVIV